MTSYLAISAHVFVRAILPSAVSIVPPVACAVIWKITPFLLGFSLGLLMALLLGLRLAVLSVVLEPSPVLLAHRVQHDLVHFVP